MGRRAVVVGGGLGGLSAAVALTRIGWSVDVYEQAPAFGPVGAGVGIAPNAVRATDRLGVGDRFRSTGVRQEGLEIRVRTGRRLVHLPADAVEGSDGAPFVALHRASAHRILLDAIDPATLHTGHRATRVTTEGGIARVDFEGPSGPVTASADLVVAADGVHSGLRAHLFPEYPGATYAGYTVWRGIVPGPEVRRIGVQPVLTETWGRGLRFGWAVIDDGRVYWFGCEPAPEHSAPRIDLSRLIDHYRGWHPPITELLAATPEDSLLQHDVHYLRDRLPAFVRGRVALLGDAAHAVTPDIGQGACLAIEDAVVLAGALDGNGSVEAALRSYDVVRRPRAQPMAITSGRIGRMLHIRNPMATALRDTVARLLPTAAIRRFAGRAFGWTPPDGTR